MKRVIYTFLIPLIISIYPIEGWADKPVRPSETRAIIEKSAGLIKRYRGKDLSEANTKILLIEPILEKLGWRVMDPDDVDREYTISPKKMVDYALKIKRPLLFLDVLPLDRSLYDRTFIEKIIGFADEKDVKWVIITNGNEYRLYKTDEKGSIDKKEKDVLPAERTEKRVAIIEKDVQILDGTVEEGDKVFHEICFACHGERGEGDAFGRQFGTDTGQTVGPTLCGGALKNVSNNQLRKIITYGRTTAILHGIDMPNWGEILSHREIGSVMLYLKKCNEIALEMP